MRPNIFQITALVIAALAGGVIVFECLEPGDSAVVSSRFERTRNSDAPAPSTARQPSNITVTAAPVLPATVPQNTVSRTLEKTSVPQIAAPVPQVAVELPPQKVKHVKPPIEDLLARTALSYVGVDPQAEEYWESAINNPNLSADERKDLIEDLNEDGLSDPKNPGPEDMPLIASRLMLIEELAPYAMDQVNADAFAEAYKDLAGMLNGETPK